MRMALQGGGRLKGETPIIRSVSSVAFDGNSDMQRSGTDHWFNAPIGCLHPGAKRGYPLAISQSLSTYKKLYLYMNSNRRSELC